MKPKLVDTQIVDFSVVESFPLMARWNLKHILSQMTKDQVAKFRIRYFKYWTGGPVGSGKVLPFKLETNTKLES